MSGQPPSFVALDFETANASPRSAVAVGLVRVDDGAVTTELVQLIRPPTRSFTNAAIHGITEIDVADADDFERVWWRLARWLDGARFLAAHHAEFDRRVLEASCERAQLPMPRLPFVCTVALARTTWGMRTAKLPHVCRQLGIELRHHDPGSDARACAEIVLAAWATEAGQGRISRICGWRRRD